MKIRIRYVLPALLTLAGCATTSDTSYPVSSVTAPAVAAPQRVDAVSDVLGAKMDGLLASRHSTNSE